MYIASEYGRLVSWLQQNTSGRGVNDNVPAGDYVVRQGDKAYTLHRDAAANCMTLTRTE